MDLLEEYGGEEREAISRAQILKYAKSNGMHFYETSSYWERQDIVEEPELLGVRGGVENFLRSLVLDHQKELT
jgi:hypothetical protein